jgi:hypothetical protein
MSTEKVVALGRLIMNDEKLRNELLAQVEGKSADDAAEAAAAFANKRGYQATPEEVKEVYVAFIQGGTLPGGGELAEAELEAVAGGPGSKTASIADDHSSPAQWALGLIGAIPGGTRGTSTGPGNVPNSGSGGGKGKGHGK